MLSLEALRLTLRLNNDALDEEILSTRDTALLDLGTAGVSPVELDALVDQAVKLYVRWQFDFCGQGERYRQAYEALKACLSLVGGYREEGNP